MIYIWTTCSLIRDGPDSDQEIDLLKLRQSIKDWR